MRIGYARVSTTGQSLDVQEAELARWNCDEIKSDKASGTRMEGREELKALLKAIRPGDEVYITRLDRLARSLSDLMAIASTIQKAGASLHVTQQAIETKTPAGRLFFAILGAIAQFETELRKERQSEGIAARKAKGGPYHTNRKPRKPTFSRQKMLDLRTIGMSIPQIASTMDCAQYTVRRALKGENHA